MSGERDRSSQPEEDEQAVVTISKPKDLQTDEEIDAFLAELAHRRGEVTAQVTAARDLSDSQKDALLEALRKAVGAKVQMDLRIDQSLIGGLVVKVGSRMIDTSLRSKLERLELAMKGAG